ncbi:transmembrane protein 243-like [Tubulanus polymorphus]|uniref:transmembrane protein 243-like n=1 Tax=Tubulanus polymorphus TaxID=672921 RepID=UPI003DA41D38
MSASGYEDIGAEKPLFGEPRRGDRVLNLVVGGITSLAVGITLFSSFAFPNWKPVGVNVFLGICLLFICGSHLVLIYWYRQGDLEPKFRNLIYYNAFTILILCICANLYIHMVSCP